MWTAAATGGGGGGSGSGTSRRPLAVEVQAKQPPRWAPGARSAARSSEPGRLPLQQRAAARAPPAAAAAASLSRDRPLPGRLWRSGAPAARGRSRLAPSRPESAAWRSQRAVAGSRRPTRLPAFGRRGAHTRASPLPPARFGSARLGPGP